MKMIPFLMLCLAISFNGLCQNALPAGELLKTATTKAKKEGKNVLVIFTATWCKPCRFFKHSIEDVYNKQYFDDNYVVVELYNSERGKKQELQNPGADSILRRYDGDSTGVPYWLIINAAGKKLADSYFKQKGDPENSKGSNVGAPMTPEELKDFMQILKRTSRLTDSELTMISERIRQLSKNPELL